ncbi:hypothetical protein [Dickeya fangzhongdai]|uniref:hypothetical protein n=1 Tax=Dickeya fangzhongdai TaxID=1778540 RepID=UPI0026DEE431|nr:hypothetical protein [Dickeya fangzhongdai]WKV50176.1 hypothetical protein PL145_20250 [Dickeya fangzhongdai]
MKDCLIVSALDVDFGSDAFPSACASVSGNIIASQVPAGTHTDTVTITLTYQAVPHQFRAAGTRIPIG